MFKFYFTFGSEGQDFVGGWTEIIAPDFEAAYRLFEALHPTQEGCGLACGGFYTEEQFKKTSMSKNGNFGHFCHERVTVEVFK